LKVLREIERVVITQRYYGDLSFVEIANTNGLKLNTVLSHHRRALGKLRPQLTKLLGYRKEEGYE
jgi:DNA-directed RNA polymerase specialized sigma24 family protein